MSQFLSLSLPSIDAYSIAQHIFFLTFAIDMAVFCFTKELTRNLSSLGGHVCLCANMPAIKLVLVCWDWTCSISEIGFAKSKNSSGVGFT